MFYTCWVKSISVLFDDTILLSMSSGTYVNWIVIFDDPEPKGIEEPP